MWLSKNAAINSTGLLEPIQSNSSGKNSVYSYKQNGMKNHSGASNLENREYLEWQEILQNRLTDWDQAPGYQETVKLIKAMRKEFGIDFRTFNKNAERYYAETCRGEAAENATVKRFIYYKHAFDDLNKLLTVLKRSGISLQNKDYFNVINFTEYLSKAGRYFIYVKNIDQGVSRKQAFKILIRYLIHGGFLDRKTPYKELYLSSFEQLV